MAQTPATPTLSFDDFYSTTLSSAIASTDTTIPVASAPVSTEGYLVLEPDSATNREIIHYTSVSGNSVICPSVNDRGLGGTTARAHSSGAIVKMNTVAEMLKSLQDGTALSGLHQSLIDTEFDFVVSGCVWSGDSYGSTRNASMTSGVLRINGRRYTVSAVTARTFTASKDTYIDVLGNADGTATLVYTEATNNAASPALAGNSVRIGIIITGASSIAAATSVNQGQETMVLPIASSIPYAVTDSLGNLICPRDPNRKILGYRQSIANFTSNATSATQVTGLSCPVIVPTGRKVQITAYAPAVQNAAAPVLETITIWDGTVGSGTQLQAANALVSVAANPYAIAPATAITTPAATSKTYNYGFHNNSANNGTVIGASTTPAFIKVELV